MNIGTLIGPYEITGRVGAGGMGEVYRAKDTRLGRNVAIKVLPAGFAADAEQLKRFELEARATSALNHPNILSIFDFGAHAGAPYLVAELLEGETLRERLNAGPLPPRRAVELAIQLAQGLAAAHEKGIVHRDLKPENLFITQDNRLKILDFGLAKLIVPVEQPSSDHFSPTGPVSTAAGMVMGTIGYMSPEQVRGEPADLRSDLFAFGVILYEMMAGRRAFKRGSAVETMSAILHEEPPEWPPLEAAPPGLDRLVRHCMEKSPSARYQSARDLAFQLEALSSLSALSGGSSASHAAQTEKAPTLRTAVLRHWMIALPLGLLAVASAVTVTMLLRRPGPPARLPIRATILPPDNAVFEFDDNDSMVLSPDGRTLVFVAETPDGKQQLWIRPLDSLSARLLAGTEEPDYPFWSPDSRFIAFFADKKLKKISAAGGPVSVLAEAPDGTGGTWSSEGVILFTPNYLGPLFQISAAGGAAEPVKRPQGLPADVMQKAPVFLPDGRHYLYLQSGSPSARSNSYEVHAASLDGRTNQRLFESDSKVAYAGGHLLYLLGRTLVARSFDVETLKTAGDAIPVANQEVQRWVERNSGAFSVSENGALLYQSAALKHENALLLTWFDKSGKRTGSLGEAAAYEEFRISPDGKRVAVLTLAEGRQAAELWIYDVARGLKSSLLANPGYEQPPVWSSDSSRIIFTRQNGENRYEMNEIAVDGSGGEIRLLESKNNLIAADWFPDGSRLAYFEIDPANNSRHSLWALPMAGERKPVPILPAGIANWEARFSPDGKWLAYRTEHANQDDIYITPFPGTGGRILVASDESSTPVWRSDGAALLYLQKGQLMETALKISGNSLDVGATRALFPGAEKAQHFSVSADGKRFLIALSPESGSAPPSITLAIDWESGLKK